MTTDESRNRPAADKLIDGFDLARREEHADRDAHLRAEADRDERLAEALEKDNAD